MNPTIELIYSQDCPNVDLTRARLKEVLAKVGLASGWREWDREGAGVPAYVRGYGSPTVLVDGRDVGESAEAEADCCRVYPGEGRFEGAPSLEALERAIRGAGRSGGSVWARLGLALLGVSAFIETRRDDLSRRKWISFLLWRVPVLLLLIGIFWGPPRGLLWSGGFGWIGGACAVNAFRCGRTHCAIMGPLFLSLGIASAATEVGMLALDWSHIGVAGLGSVVLSYLPEWLGKRYLHANPAVRRAEGDAG